METPKNQTAEVLFELINNSYITRSTILINTGILNLTARISDLRLRHNVDVICQKVNTINKHKRKINYGKWYVNDKNNCIEIYNKINVN
jgi:hypothetical protein